MSPWPEDLILYARKSYITKRVKVTLEYCSYTVGAHNKDYVKWNNILINNQLVILQRCSFPVSQPTVVT